MTINYPSVAYFEHSLARSGRTKAGQCAPLGALVARLSVDSNATDGMLKDQYRRKRPLVAEEGPICVDRSPGLINWFDYPSGHTALGWLLGLTFNGESAWMVGSTE